jgi:hypothetical protein
MSAKNNVNKDHYTIAGRDRPNEVLPPRPRAGGDEPGGGPGAPNFIPGAAPVGETEARRDAPSSPQAQTSAGKTGVRSGSRKRATANRGGRAPGKARRKAGAGGTSTRRPANTARAKRGTTRAQAARPRPSGKRAA